MSEDATRNLYLLCRSGYEIDNVRNYVQKNVNRSKTDSVLFDSFFTLSADCLRYREIISDLRAKLAAAEKRFTAPIVCMCGSTKFKQVWIAENARLTGEGNIVLAIGLWGHHERKYPAPDVKVKLDDLHKRKIDLCDWVWVLDVYGYIGESTRSEIEYAKRLDKPIRYMSKEFPGYKEPVDQLDEHKAQSALLMDALKRLLPYAEDWSDDGSAIVNAEQALRLSPSEAYERFKLLEEIAQVAEYRQSIKHKKLDDNYEVDVLMREEAENRLIDLLQRYRGCK